MPQGSLGCVLPPSRLPGRLGFHIDDMGVSRQLDANSHFQMARDQCRRQAVTEKTTFSQVRKIASLARPSRG